METRAIKWDREKLYAEVWARPMRALADEYGLSDVGLAKICKKLQIPRPGLGYWRRKECGFAVERQPLPAAKENRSLITHVPVERKVKLNAAGPQMPALNRSEATSAQHPLVVQTRRAYAKPGTDQFGRAMPPDWRLPHLDLRVTSAGIARALVLMNNLIHLLEANGMSMSVGGDRPPMQTVARIAGEQIRVILRESGRQHRRELTVAERRDHERSPLIYPKDFALTCDPTDQFVFEIESYSDGTRRWSDRKSKKIEDCLDDIVRGLQAAAAWATRARVEREAARLRWEDEERRRRKYQERVERLKHNVGCWEEAQRIRAYLAAVREKAEARDGEVNPESSVARFLSWARGYADSLDPADSPAASDWNTTAD